MSGIDPWTLDKLEFPVIRKELANKTATPLGRELAEDLVPAADINLVLLWQQETTEARKLLEQGRQLSFTGITDLRKPLQRAERGGLLDSAELNAVARLLEASAHIQSVLAEVTESAPALAKMGGSLRGFSGMKAEIRKAVSSDGELRDTASPQLASIRRRQSDLNQQIRSRMEHYIRSNSYRQYLQEPIITVRDGRYVIPVKQEYRAQIPGVVHDSSASGATLFVEPVEQVEMGNKLKILEREEKTEIDKILSRLSALVAGEAQALLLELTTCAELDFIFAKGLLSRDMDGAVPKVLNNGSLSLLQARHPLIAREKVVPVDMQLGMEFNTLVITGPNTGGKTVSLKTAGLLTLMAQAGLHIPAREGSVISVFDRVLADIGDEQSIEQNLSTFSSHMKNIVNIINNIDGYSLILLDELGAGTDPGEGSALAMAILQFLHSREGVRTISTTHYNDLKVFAYNQEGVENASVEFNEETLSPTYHLLIGIPGRSNAISIASRLELPVTIVEQARSLIGRDEQGIEEMVSRISSDHRRLREEARMAEEARRRHEHAAIRAEKELEQLKEKHQREMEKAREEARSLISEARRRSEAMIREARQVLREAETLTESRLDRRAKEIFQPLQELESQVGSLAPVVARSQEVDPEDLTPGNKYLVISLRQQGTLLRVDTDKGEAEMQIGMMRISVPLTDLAGTPAEKKEKAAATAAGGYTLKKETSFSPELDLRGLTLEEAVQKVDKYLDDALLSGINHVYLIHGKGTGRLRKGLQEYLKSHRAVVSFRLGREGEGDSGVTVVTLV